MTIKHIYKDNNIKITIDKINNDIYIKYIIYENLINNPIYFQEESIIKIEEENNINEIEAINILIKIECKSFDYNDKLIKYLKEIKNKINIKNNIQEF